MSGQVQIVQKAIFEQASAATINLAIKPTSPGTTLLVFAFSSGSTAIVAPTAPAGTWGMGNSSGAMPTSSKLSRWMWLPTPPVGSTVVTWTPTAAAANAGIAFYELAEADQRTPLDVQTTGTTNAGSTAVSDSALTPSAPNAMFFMGAVMSIGGDAFSQGAPSAGSLFDPADWMVGQLGFFAVQAKRVSSIQAGAFTIAPSDEWGTMSIVIDARGADNPAPDSRYVPLRGYEIEA